MLNAAERVDPIARLRVRAALVHDWLQGYHGAERVVEALRTDLFDTCCRPPIYTFHAAEDVLPPDLAAGVLQQSKLSRLPGMRQRGFRPGHWRLLLPYMPYYFSRLDLSSYDLVISSSHACAHHARARQQATHVVYCHTPMRYLWSTDVESQRLHGVHAAAFHALKSEMRRLDREAAQRPTSYIANSTAVQRRIKAAFGRDSIVIPPPVDTHDLRPTPGRDDFFLWVHRLVAYKNPLAVVEAFRGLPYRLKMVGVGPLEREIRNVLPNNVSLISWTSREELTELYSRALGFVHVAEEDFGISMAEALAAGTPVIGLNRGGALDIVVPGQDGLLLSSADATELRHALRDVAEQAWDREAIAARATARFSRESFARRMLEHISSL